MTKFGFLRIFKKIAILTLFDGRQEMLIRVRGQKFSDKLTEK